MATESVSLVEDAEHARAQVAEQGEFSVDHRSGEGAWAPRRRFGPSACIASAVVCACLAAAARFTPARPSTATAARRRQGAGVPHAKDRLAVQRLPQVLRVKDGKKAKSGKTSKSACHTAVYPEECFSSVEWAMTVGLPTHPEWYEGLDTSSSFEEFQEHVFWFNDTLCPKPCEPESFRSGPLFCFAVARMDTSDGVTPECACSEEELLRAQLQQGGGIFGCDDFAVLSDVDRELGDGPFGAVKTLLIPSTLPDGVTKDGTVQNTQVFLQAWDVIRKDGRYLRHDWTIKVDPDAVLVPARLRSQLSMDDLPENPFPPPYESDSNSGWWVTNCDMEGMLTEWGHGWPMMYGAAEVLSKQAMRVWLNGIEECKSTIDWANVGEDAFIGLCLRQLQVGELFVKMGDKRCGGATCSDTDKFVFHDFKSPDEWLGCWDQTQEG